MKRYAIRTEPGRERRAPSFEEQLYEHMRSAPWWLASAGVHAAGLLLLSILAGGATVAPALADPMRIAGPDDSVALDPEIPPPVVETTPMDERNDTVVTDVEFKEVPDQVEFPVGETTESPLSDSRFSGQGPFDGEGSNAVIGTGPGAGGDPLFRGREGRRHLKLDGRGDTMPATLAALEWLAHHQSPDGRWDCDNFESMCRSNRCGGPGGPLHDAGVTGLALLAFLGYGETNKTPVYGRVVRNGLKYLKGIQDAEGCFGSRTGNHFVYGHAIAALAMAEAYGCTGSLLFKTSAQNGIDFVLRCQNPYLAWRYGVRPQDNDTSVTGWMVMALKSGMSAGLDVDPAAFDGTRAWLDKVTEPEYGRAGYTARGNGPARPQELMDRFPADRSESLTAVATLLRVFCGAKPGDEFVRKGADLMLRCPPVWDEAAGTIDHYYWYYGTLAMFQIGGEHWKKWNEAMGKAIVGSQRMEKGDDRFGSWDPVDPWGPEGGRVYSTALNALSLEVYYRCLRVFGVR